jgi:hypothetical protein
MSIGLQLGLGGHMPTIGSDFMERTTLLDLGRYLNVYIEPFDSCDGSLSQTMVWLEANGRNVEQEIEWLQAQGVTCDCEVVTKLYIPTRFGLK